MTWKQRRKLIDAQVKRYELSRDALTKDAVGEMYREKNAVIAECPHEHTTHKTGHWRDQGYGCDRWYPCEWVECDYCKKTLSGERGN